MTESGLKCASVSERFSLSELRQRFCHLSDLKDPYPYCFVRVCVVVSGPITITLQAASRLTPYNHYTLLHDFHSITFAPHAASRLPLYNHYTLLHDFHSVTFAPHAASRLSPLSVHVDILGAGLLPNINHFDILGTVLLPNIKHVDIMHRGFVCTQLSSSLSDKGHCRCLALNVLPASVTCTSGVGYITSLPN